ncbi:serine O-acetyltransferase EpsC [Klebsiella variicola]|uniref:serine O-acetyltransferase EpsC n=1 Tax=Klebsiella variicola TaxID=244366 RepID=UPI00339C49FA
MLWSEITNQAKELSVKNGRLSNFLKLKIFYYDNFASALSGSLADMLQLHAHGVVMNKWFSEILYAAPDILASAEADIRRLVIVNPACPDHLTGFLSFRGILAVQAYRIAHHIWNAGDCQSAVLLQNWIAAQWNIDIHPGARLGSGLFIDHGMGIVIGETAVVEDEVSIWHGVTLGSTLTEAGDRHPKIRHGALICAHAAVLGNIEVGAGSIVAANSVVLSQVSPGVVVAGSPAKVVAQAPASLATFTTKS